MEYCGHHCKGGMRETAAAGSSSSRQSEISPLMGSPSTGSRTDRLRAARSVLAVAVAVTLVAVVSLTAAGVGRFGGQRIADLTVGAGLTNVTVVGDVATIRTVGSDMYTTVDLKTGRVRSDPLGEEEEDVGVPNLFAPDYVPRGEAHTYFPWEWKEKALSVPVHNGMDGVVEAPETATFRRHYDNWRNSLVSDETSEHAALRIFSMFPSFGTENPELYPAVQEPAAIEPVVDHPETPFRGSNPIYQETMFKLMT